MPNQPDVTRARVVALYAVMLMAATATFFWIRSLGERLPAPAGDLIAESSSPVATAVPAVNTLFQFLLALAIIIATRV